MNPKKAVLFIGSPKERSASEALGAYLLGKLKEKGLSTDKIKIDKLVSTERGQLELFDAVNQADIIIFSCPLYVDSPPAPVIKAMELITENRKGKGKENGKKFLAISNCGFPEAFHNHTALEIYKEFASEAGFKWLGGLALGGGPAVQSSELTKIGGMAKNIMRSLDTAANDIVEKEALSHEAVELIARPLVPAWMYLFIAGFEWKIQAKKHGVSRSINDCPYE